MYIAGDRVALAEAAKTAASAAGREMLANVLIETTETGIRLTATDAERAVRVDVACTVDEPGELMTPAAAFASALRTLPGPVVEVRVVRGRLAIETVTGAVTRIPVVSVVDAPEMPAQEAGALRVTVDGGELAAWAARMAKAPIGTPERYGLNGVDVALTADGLAGVATDGHALVVAGLGCVTEGEAPARVLVPADALDAIARARLSGPAVLTLSRSGMEVTCGPVTLWSRMIDGEFPDWSAFVTGDTRGRATFATADLDAAFARCEIAGSNVRVELEGDRAKLSASSAEREHSEGVNAEIEGAPLVCGLSPKLTRAALAHIGTDRVSVHYSHALAPVFVTCEGATPTAAGSADLAIVMPMRID